VALLTAWAPVLLWVLATRAGAQPLPVAHDAGPGVPIGVHLAPVLAPMERTGASELVQFPVRTPGLAPGRLAGTPRWPDAQWLTQPMFLVGSDAGSRRWLQQHRRRLLEMQAAGLVVQAPDDAAFKRLQALAEGLPMTPAPAPWLSQRLAALHAAVLPLLVLQDGTLTQRPGQAGGAAQP
jgi:integrating conjugative element protein (TIGR03765 family)